MLLLFPFMYLIGWKYVLLSSFMFIVTALMAAIYMAIYIMLFYNMSILKNDFVLVNAGTFYTEHQSPVKQD